MKKIFVSAILFCLAIIMIISGVSLSYFNSYREDKEITLAYVASTEKYYHNIHRNLEIVHPYMVSMNDFFNLYYEEAINARENYDSVMKQIQNIKFSVDSDYQNMISICKQKIANIESDQCDDIVTSYSNFSTTYDVLLENYQDFVEQCNKWSNNI